MTHDFTLPDVGEGVAEGEVVQWLVSVGDTVTEDQPIVEIETDKALVEIPSPTGEPRTTGRSTRNSRSPTRSTARTSGSTR